MPYLRAPPSLHPRRSGQIPGLTPLCPKTPHWADTGGAGGGCSALTLGSPSLVDIPPLKEWGQGCWRTTPCIQGTAHVLLCSSQGGVASLCYFY